MAGIPRPERPRLKIILVGDSGVGKTSLIASFLKKPYDPTVISTVSPAYIFHDVARPDGLTICLQIWDTAGQERYRSVSQLFYRDADVALVCFESGNDDSLETVPDWIAHVRKEVPDCKFIFVGTKCDLLPPGGADEALASAQRALREHAPRAFHVTSSLTNEGVEAVFLAASELYARGAHARAQEQAKLEARPAGRANCCDN
jgi:small GTP-binding protein